MNIFQKFKREVLIYFSVLGSLCLGWCSFKKMRAFFYEYTRFRYRNLRRKLGIPVRKPRVYYNGKKILTTDETNKLIGAAIEHGEPFMAGRFGSVEINAIWRVRDDGKGFIAPYSEALEALEEQAGFFPKDKNLMPKFAKLMKWATSQVNFMAIWFNPMEEYIMRTYGNNPEYCSLGSLSAFDNEYSWTKKLEGKKVLVIHPFYKSIPYQYARRELIFPGKNILPKFELIMQRSVQTVARNRDPRFQNWFEALDFMYNEAMSKDFDIAIIGCGAYGFPLAAKIKQAGKMAIHLGGVTQILFGIKGKRWENSKLFNENWVRPSPEETPKGFQGVDNGSYW